MQLEVEAQTALREAAANFPQPLGSFGGLLMNAGVAPLGNLMRPYSMPRDALTKEVARLLTTPSAVHKMMCEQVYVAENGGSRLAALLDALPVCVDADKAQKAAKKAKREPTAEEAALIAKATALRDVLIQVDVHERVGPLEEAEGYVRPAIASTQHRLHGAAADFTAAQAAAA